jgi:UDP-N-acetylglucosamine 2-epimerase
MNEAKQMKILTVFGTRPDIIKLSPVIPLLDQSFKQILVHTGQHYSYNMDQLFFDEIQLRAPDYTLNVGSGTHAQQTSRMIIGVEEAALKEKPNLILVQGDTNSTLSGALVAAKLNIPLAHIESGYRSFNVSMPEEVNRIITDRFSEYLFAGDDECVKNLRAEGIDMQRCYLVGNTAIDALRRNEQFSNDMILQELSLKTGTYVLITFHRASNTNNIQNLVNIVGAINELSKKIHIVFPIHPRTQEALVMNNLTLSEHVQRIEPTGYLNFISLMKNARFIMSDSGGIQEESVELNIPCLVLRNETEAQEILRSGKTKLTTTSKDEIIRKGELLIGSNQEIQRMKSLPFIGKSGVAAEIVRILREKLVQ